MPTHETIEPMFLPAEWNTMSMTPTRNIHFAINDNAIIEFVDAHTGEFHSKQFRQGGHFVMDHLPQGTKIINFMETALMDLGSYV